jgi:hypothetical protein
MKVEGWGGKMKNREEWSRLFRRPKLTLSCSAEAKEGSYISTHYTIKDSISYVTIIIII